MNLSIGPFNLIFLILLSAIIYVAGFYFVFKNRLGLIGFLTILFFPMVGSLGVIAYSMTRKVH